MATLAPTGGVPPPVLAAAGALDGASLRGGRSAGGASSSWVLYVACGVLLGAVAYLYHRMLQLEKEVQHARVVNAEAVEKLIADHLEEAISSALAVEESHLHESSDRDDQLLEGEPHATTMKTAAAVARTRAPDRPPPVAGLRSGEPTPPAQVAAREETVGEEEEEEEVVMLPDAEPAVTEQPRSLNNTSSLRREPPQEPGAFLPASDDPLLAETPPVGAEREPGGEQDFMRHPHALGRERKVVLVIVGGGSSPPQQPQEQEVSVPHHQGGGVGVIRTVIAPDHSPRDAVSQHGFISGEGMTIHEVLSEDEEGEGAPSSGEQQQQQQQEEEGSVKGEEEEEGAQHVLEEPSSPLAADHDSE